MRLCKCGCGEALPSSAFHRQLFLDMTHRNRYHEVRRGHGDRPTGIACVRCGQSRPVAVKGKVPRFCGSECAQEHTKEHRKASTVRKLAGLCCELCAGPLGARHGTRRYCSDCVRRVPVIHRYGITASDWVAIGETQDWCCAICREGGDRVAAVRGLCVDHCHDTGQVRGLLCRTCNTGIGHLRDDLTLVHSAAEYLENAHRPQLRLIEGAA